MCFLSEGGLEDRMLTYPYGLLHLRKLRLIHDGACLGQGRTKGEGTL